MNIACFVFHSCNNWAAPGKSAFRIRTAEYQMMSGEAPRAVCAALLRFEIRHSIFDIFFSYARCFSRTTPARYHSLAGFPFSAAFG
jgi:hypothetical protein